MKRTRTIEARRIRELMDSQGYNQTTLAEESGISRPQLSRILLKERPAVRQETLRRLTQALRCRESDIVSGGGPLRRFLEAQQEEQGFIDFRGLGLPRIDRLPLVEIFVDPTVDEEPVVERECASEIAGRRRLPTRFRKTVLPAQECIGKLDRVVLLGHPGSGKTTLIRHFATCARPDDTFIPVLVRLSELAQYLENNRDGDIFRFLASRYAGAHSTEVESALRNAAAEGRCRFFFDGLDEIGSRDWRERVTESLETLIAQYSRNRFVLTSRIVGFIGEPWRSLGFAVYRLQGYGDQQIEALADKWSRILARFDKRPAKKIQEDLNRAVFLNKRVRSLAANPLILTILVLLNESRGGVLPRRRVDLYEKVVDVFLETWETSKQLRAELDDVGGIDFDAREFRWMLSDVSLAMQKAGLTLAARWWLADRVQDYLCTKLGFLPDQAKQTSDRIIRYLTERTGLLTERGPDRYGFTHRTLQEYFASLGVIDEADASAGRDVAETLRPYFFHPQWSEVVRLTAAQLTPPVAETLIAGILDDSDPVGRFLCRGTLLALDCLSDGTTIADRRLVSGLFEQLQPLGRSRWLGIALQAIRVLQSFEDTRYAQAAQDTIEAILAAAQRELEPEDFECLQERAYREDVVQQICSELESAPPDQAAWEFPIKIQGVEEIVGVVNGTLWQTGPEKWYESACEILEDVQASIPMKLELIRLLRQRVVTDGRARMRLKKLLLQNPVPEVRAACARSLGSVATGRQNAKNTLLKALRTDQDELVRRDCAASLGAAAVDDLEVRRLLLKLLDSDPSDAVRIGAAQGLDEGAKIATEVRDALTTTLRDPRTPDGLRAACGWSLADLLPDEESLLAEFHALVESQPGTKAGRAAAQALAAALADEDVPWNPDLVGRVQDLLMSLDEPCPHALDCLERLATARAVNRGLRLEAVIGDALKPLATNIDYVFVFGSTARKQQHPDSDIDLMLIGDLRMRQVSPLLSDAERMLGRRINPAIYSRQSFRDKIQAGDPFLLDVFRREKLPVRMQKTTFTQKELDHELGELVAER